MRGVSYASFRDAQNAEGSSTATIRRSAHTDGDAARIRSACRARLETLVAIAIRNALPLDFGQPEVARIASAYVPDSDADTWAPIELRGDGGDGDGVIDALRVKVPLEHNGRQLPGSVDRGDGRDIALDILLPSRPPASPSSSPRPPAPALSAGSDAVRLGWRVFCQLHTHRALADLRLDARSRIVYGYSTPVSHETLRLVTDFVTLNARFPPGGPYTVCAVADERAAHSDREPPPSLPQQYVGTHIRDCAQLTPVERYWATRLWDRGPAAMLDVLEFMERECEDYRVPPLRRVTEITQLALAILTPNTRLGPCLTVDAALGQRTHATGCRRCLRRAHACWWACVVVCVAALAALAVFVCVGDGVEFPRPFAQSLVALTCLPAAAACVWCSGAAVRAFVLRHLGDCLPPTCVGIGALVCLAILFTNDVFRRTGSSATDDDAAAVFVAVTVAAKIVACTLAIVSCCICVLTCRLAGRRPHQGGFLTPHTRSRPAFSHNGSGTGGGGATGGFWTGRYY